MLLSSVKKTMAVYGDYLLFKIDDMDSNMVFLIILPPLIKDVRLCLLGSSNPMIINQRTAISVSYTHLDVYKRQPHVQA